MVTGPCVAWTAVAILTGFVGLPAYALGHVAERERRARGEVERLNAELTGTLTRLQGAQAELVVAGIAVRRLRTKVARAALARAGRAARHAGIPALTAEVESVSLALDTPAARLIARGGEPSPADY